MSETDTGTVPGDIVETAQGEESAGQTYVSKSTQSVRQAAESGALAGFGGGVGLLWGLLTLGRGDRKRGLARLLLGGSLVAVAIAQRRSTDDRDGERTDVDQTDVVGSSTDIEAVASREKADDGRHASGDEARDIVDSSVNIENAGSGPELDSDAEETGVDQTDVVGSGIDDESLDSAADGSDE